MSRSCSKPLPGRWHILEVDGIRQHLVNPLHGGMQGAGMGLSGFPSPRGEHIRDSALERNQTRASILARLEEVRSQIEVLHDTLDEESVLTRQLHHAVIDLDAARRFLTSGGYVGRWGDGQLFTAEPLGSSA